jgi:hypothetical protein
MLKAVLHTLVAFGATMLVWTVLMGWGPFVSGQYIPKFGAWGTFRFGMMIAFFIASVSCGVFLVASIVAHYIRGRIAVNRLVGSSLTLTFANPLIGIVSGGANPLLMLLLIGLPLVSAIWLIGPKKE